MSWRPRRTGVYPRVCGGTTYPADWKTRRRGLSPRVRGNRLRLDNAILNERSIPACAGEPADYAQPAALDAVYPRVCGGTVIRRDGGHVQ